MSKKKSLLLVIIAFVVGALVGGVAVYGLKGKTQKVTLGNPVAGMSQEEAFQIALSLAEGKDMGSWSTMSAEQFLLWWQESNQ